MTVAGSSIRTFATVRQPQARGRCPFCRKRPRAVTVQVWARAKDYGAKTPTGSAKEKTVGTCSRGMCESCAVEVYEKFAAVLQR